MKRNREAIVNVGEEKKGTERERRASDCRKQEKKGVSYRILSSDVCARLTRCSEVEEEEGDSLLRDFSLTEKKNPIHQVARSHQHFCRLH